MNRPSLPHLAAVALLLAAAVTPPLVAAKPDPLQTLAAAQRKLDQDDPEAALALLDPLLKREPKLALAYLLRGTARLMLGEDSGKADLDRAITLDPTLKQAWLDRAAVAVSEKRYDAALADFQKARDLDPADPGGMLNVGAMQLLLGKVDDASRSFQSYLGLRPRDADAHYLVARNYALAGYAGLAIQSLQQSIALDERMRAGARVDANFVDLASNPRFQEILRTDGYQPAAGAPHAERLYVGAYGGGKGPLLPATLDALQTLGESFDARVEVTAEWALLWGALRIKLSDGPNGQGQVALVPRQEGMSAADWQQKSTRLLDTILIQLAKRRTLGTAPKPPAPGG